MSCPLCGQLGVNMRTLIFVSVVGLLLTTLSPSAAAFHGSPYTVYGTACLPDREFCTPTEMQWGGNNVYRFRFGEAPLQSAWINVNGRESFRGVSFVAEPWCSASQALEVALYHGTDTATGGDILTVDGSQKNCMAGNGPRRIELTGHLYTFQLDLRLATG